MEKSENKVEEKWLDGATITYNNLCSINLDAFAMT